MPRKRSIDEGKRCEVCGRRPQAVRMPGGAVGCVTCGELVEVAERLRGHHGDRHVHRALRLVLNRELQDLDA